LSIIVIAKFSPSSQKGKSKKPVLTIYNREDYMLDISIDFFQIYEILLMTGSENDIQLKLQVFEFSLLVILDISLTQKKSMKIVYSAGSASDS